LAWNHRWLGFLLASRQRWAEAEVQHSKARGIQEGLAAASPRAPDDLIVLAGDYCDFGKLKLNSGHPDESLAWFQKAIDILRPAHDRDPKDANLKIYLRECHWGRARAFGLLRRHPEAVADWGQAIELAPPGVRAELRASRANSLLLAGQPDEAVAEVVDLATLDWHSYRWVNFGCICAVASKEVVGRKQQYADLAMQMLQRAVQAGYDVPANIAHNPELDPLRDRDDFRKLLADLEAKFRPR
jgi:tetratricopeptide (TPR) repeat protein